MGCKNKEGNEDDYRLHAEIKAEKVRIYFNNHARSKAVRNAFQLMDMLLIDHKSKEIGLQDQYTLGSFFK